MLRGQGGDTAVAGRLHRTTWPGPCSRSRGGILMS